MRVRGGEGENEKKVNKLISKPVFPFPQLTFVKYVPPRTSLARYLGSGSGRGWVYGPIFCIHLIIKFNIIYSLRFRNVEIF